MSSSINAFFTVTSPCCGAGMVEIHALQTPKLRQCSPEMAIIAAPRRVDALGARILNFRDRSGLHI
jgi:hypothetical protein